MAAYTKSAAPTGTLTKAALDAEIALVLTAARSIDNTQIRTAAVLSHRKLEYPRTVATVNGCWSVFWSPYWVTGCGRPTVLQNEHGLPTIGVGNQVEPALTAGKAYPDIRACYANHVVAVVTVPNFTHSTAQIPRVRIASVSMTTVHPKIDPWPNTASGMLTNQDIGNEMSALVYRITPSRVNASVPTYGPVTSHPFDTMSDKIDVSLVARKDGLTVIEEQAASATTDLSQVFADNQFVWGSGGDESYQGALVLNSAPETFQAMTLMGGESFGTMAPMVPGDNILLVLTGTDLLLDPQIDANDGNVFTPVMPAKGAAWTVDFEAEWAQ